MEAPIYSATKWIGIAAGLMLAAVLVLSWRVPAEGRPLAADMRLVALPAGEIAVEPGGVFLSGQDLSAGGRRAHGAVALRNVTGHPLDVRLRLVPSSRGLDRAVRLRLRAEGQPIATGPLGTLRDWSARSLRLAPGGDTILRASAWIPAGAAARTGGGQTVEVTTELRASPVGGQP